MGRYCHTCGEKEIDEEELTLVHFLGTVWNAITFSDTKFIRTIVALIFKPGFLTWQYFQGRRKLFTAPLALFFFINLLYFLYQPFDALNSNIYSQTKGQVYSDWAHNVVINKIIAEDWEETTFADNYNDLSSQISKLFLVLLILFFAAVLSLINIRRKKLLYFHLINSSHFISFTILGFLILMPAIVSGVASIIAYFSGEMVVVDANGGPVGYFLLSLIVIYAYFMQQRLFKEHKLKSLIKAILICVGFAGSVVLYRLFLFLMCMWLM